MKRLFSLTPEVERSSEVAEGFLTVFRASDAGFTGVGRWTQRLVLDPAIDKEKNLFSNLR
jgi:hypothetical protein